MRIVIVLVSLLLASSSIAEAARRRPRDLAREALDLARVCVSEASFELGPDCPAIAAVLRRRPFGGISEAAARYSPRVVGARPPRTSRQVWIAGLRADLAEPVGWPASAGPWTHYRGLWRAILASARTLVEAENVPCSVPPDHWGGPMDRARAARLGYRRIDCGKTRNDFYTDPTTTRRRGGSRR